MSLSRSGRRIVYTDQTPFETDVLYTNLYNMVNAAYLAQAVLGGSPTSNATLVSGLACVQNSVPNLSVLIGAGVMFNFQEFDATDYGAIPADPATTDKLYKLYIQTTQLNSAASTPTGIGLPLTFTPPVSGTTNYLLQATFKTQDVDSASRPYFNPSNPDAPIYQSAAQTRQDTIFYSLKSAVSPAIPTPDAGYAGLYVIAVASGATTILSSNISLYPGAPFITENLTQKISQATADTLYAPLNSLIRDNHCLLGDFGTNPWQDGTSFTGIADGTYIADGFQWIQNGTAVLDASKSSNVPSVAVGTAFSTASMQTIVTTAQASLSAANYYAERYVVEGYDFANLAQRDITISFSVLATVTGTYTVGISNSNGDRAYAATYTVSASNTWERKTITIPASPSAGTWNYTNGVGLDLMFVQGSGSTAMITPNSWVSGGATNKVAATGQANNLATNGNLFRIDLIKIEIGTSATAYSGASIDEVIAKAQRYYETSYSIGVVPGTNTGAGSRDTAFQAVTAAGDMLYADVYKVNKRTIPSVTIYSLAGNAGFATQDNASEIAVTTLHEGMTAHKIQGINVVGRYAMQHHFVADARFA